MAIKKYRLLLISIALFIYFSIAFYLQHVQPPSHISFITSLLLVPMIISSLCYGLAGTLISTLLVFSLLYWFEPKNKFELDYWFDFIIFSNITIIIGIIIQLQSYYERRITYILSHDPGTKLPSRLSLWHAIDNTLFDPELEQNPNGLAIIAVDNLHDISITFDHNVADELLVTLWKRIAHVFYPSAKAYHYHRERLAVLFHNPESNLNTLEYKFQACLEDSVIYSGIPIHFTARIGYVEIKSDSRGKRTLINEAESALVFAKEKDKLLVVFNENMRYEKKEALAILGSVHRAMHLNDLTLYYQPKINLQDNCIVGFEALARWNDRELGVLSPDDFIPLIENTELIHAFTYWAIDKALQTVARWKGCGLNYYAAVNISSHNLTDEEFSDKVKSLLKKYQLPSTVLELEITETEVMKNPEQSIKILEEIADIPIIISIDDFGTGYSSLAYLNRLPVTALKIDRAFTSQLETDNNVKEIVKAAINLGHALHMKVIAEGIETEKQRALLHQLGCDIGQGYLFSPAIPEKESVTWTWNG